MNESDLNSGNNGVNRTQSDWVVDIEAVIEQIWNDLDGTTSYSEIRRVITEVAPLYDDVRITTYVPIFLRRDVLRRFSQYQRAMVDESKNRRLEEIAN
jgi:hypothetical protein